MTNYWFDDRPSGSFEFLDSKELTRQWAVNAHMS